MSVSKSKVSQKFTSLVKLAEQVVSALDTLKEATRQLSKSGVRQDEQVLQEQLPKLQILDLLTSLETLQNELRDTGHNNSTDAAEQNDAASQKSEVEPLGLRDRQVVAQALDLVLVFEVLPRQAPGVGVPLNKRLSSEAAAAVIGSLMRLPGGQRTCEVSASTSLSDIALRLCKIIDNALPSGGDVASFLVGKYHSDMIAMLLQLAYAPVPQNQQQMPKYQVETNAERRIELQRAFTRVFDSSNPYLLLETLTSLLNAAIKGQQRAPRWFVIVCSRFLSRVLMKYPHDGARITIDFIVGHDSELSAGKLDRVSSLLLTPPANADASEYLARIVPQLVDMIVARNIAAGQTGTNETEMLISNIMDRPAAQQRMAQTATYTLRVLAEKHPEAFAAHVVQPLCQPLRRWFDTRTITLGASNDSINNTMRKEKATQFQLSTGPSATRRPKIEVIDNSPPSDSNQQTESNMVVASTYELTQSVYGIQELVLGGGIPSAPLLARLVVPVFGPLFHWFSYELTLSSSKPTSTAASTAIDVLRDLLVITLRVLPQSAATSTLLELIQHERGTIADLSEDWPVFSISDSGSHHTQLVWRTSIGADNDQSQQQTISIDALVDILQSSKLRALTGHVFLTLLREQGTLFEEMMTRADMGSGRHEPTNEHEMALQLSRKWWLVSQVVLALVEKVGPAVLTRHADVLAFVLGVLDRHSAATIGTAEVGDVASDINRQADTIEELMESLNVNPTNGAVTTAFDIPNASNAVEQKIGGTEMVVLALLLLGQILTASEEAAFREQLPGSLSKDNAPRTSEGTETMPKIEWDTGSLQLLRQIQDKVRQLGSNSNTVHMVTQLANQVKLQTAMILALHHSQPQSDTKSSAADRSEPEVERFENALRDSHSELVPIRAHGIIELRNMVIGKSLVLDSTDRMEAVIGVFLKMVQEADTFLYLNAIRGLSALADHQGHRFIPQLVAMYTDSTSTIDQRLRVGESLQQSIERAGEMLGDYSEHIVPRLLDQISVTESNDGSYTGVVIQSTLSILAAIARTCPLGLQKWIAQVIHAVDSLMIVMADKEDEMAIVVRRAAVVVCVDLIHGYGERLMELVDMEVLQNIHRILRRIRLTDSDELVCGHAQTGIDAISEEVKDQILGSWANPLL
ncbi:hypothetical protein H4R24_001902 [Coemansia sp. RSA 988]|nr:hypothetical protein H4R24_001902 [Coemansia sp. RSA 988]